MKSNLIVPAFALLSIGITACAGAESPNPATKPSQQETVTVNAEAADTYFNRFIATTTGSCDKSIYFWRINSEDVLVGKTERGLDIRASVSIFMHSDHTYVAQYGESVVKEYNESGWSGYVLNKKDVTGEWRVEGGRLIFSDFASAEGVIINGVSDLRITYLTDVVTTGLTTKNVIGYYNWGTAGEVSQNEFCAQSK
ncbi:MAG: hypothetical protein EOP06_03915 [Proteobacteria bacterium]|nr:MAG: hypothetical protein EOP06_03915 [Pseudomonadota bacterium]